ncbi:MAG: hypothetical protein V5B38_14620 [Candidatus Accumulibacter propinquus]
MPMLAPTKNSCLDRHRRVLQDIQNLLRDVRDGIRPDDPLYDNQEFVATQAANGIGFTHQPAEPPGHLAENAITDLMAKGVVDVLEAVEVDEQYGQSALVAVRTLQCLVQTVAKQQPVGQTGQRIVMCLVIQLIVGVAQFGDVGEHPDIMREMPILVLDGADRQGLQKGLAVLSPVPEFARQRPHSGQESATSRGNSFFPDDRTAGFAGCAR